MNDKPDVVGGEESRSTVKVFALNDCEWWAGYDLDSVKAAFLEQGYGDESSFDDNPCALTPAEMETLEYCDDLASFPEVSTAQTRTFKEQLALMVVRGDKFPCFFASTEY